MHAPEKKLSRRPLEAFVRQLHITPGLRRPIAPCTRLTAPPRTGAMKPVKPLIEDDEARSAHLAPARPMRKPAEYAFLEPSAAAFACKRSAPSHLAK